ncbi:ABC transporter permease subunit [Akkermansia sp. N21169]|jgi:ABC-2 type transport system permease protein|uniref:ABC transporter permease n=1 Tax=unclassified Akkermansia TaxID=2608915 RepID=UPI00244E7D88|nr:ABC transporter permease subunit [Akkermansia sp. N21169]
MSFLSSGYVPSPRRIAVIAGATFTQLMRMKIFIFLLVFALVILAVNCIRTSDFLGPETYGENELTLIKNSAFGAMRLFGLVFCVTATALLIPKDTEDRILYTILCKPVPRIDYLVGKAVGVLALATLAMLVMDLFSTGILWMRTGTVIAEQSQILHGTGIKEDSIAPILDRISAQGPTWNVQAGMLVMMMEFTVLTSITLLLSCLTGGTIISTLLAFGVYVVGIFQTQAKIMWMESSHSIGISDWSMAISKGISAVFPNFSMYSITDAAVNGQAIPLPLLGELALITLAYFLFHSTLSAWIFRNKEF